MKKKINNIVKLTDPVERTLFHKRVVQCQGFKRKDGKFDIEGHLIDTKTYKISVEHGEVIPGQPLHEMFLRITINEELEILSAEASTHWAPYLICGDIVSNFSKLKGLKIKSGFTAQVKNLLGGVNGCTHLVELLGPMATTAFQTIYSERSMKKDNFEIKTPPPLLNSCHGWSDSKEMIQKRFPKFYKIKKG